MLVIDIVATRPYKAKVQVLHCMIHVEKKRTGNFLRKLSDFPMSHTSRGSLSCALSDFCSFFPCDFLSLEKQFIQILTTQHNLNTFLRPRNREKERRNQNFRFSLITANDRSRVNTFLDGSFHLRYIHTSISLSIALEEAQF